MAKQLKKYDPKQAEIMAFKRSVGLHVLIECASIDFDDMVEDGILVPYKPDESNTLNVVL
jgi:hypothetical protein